MTFESEACKHLSSWIETARKTGEEESARLIEFILMDEVTHVQLGKHWVEELTKDVPEWKKQRGKCPLLPITQVGVHFIDTAGIPYRTNQVRHLRSAFNAMKFGLSSMPKKRTFPKIFKVNLALEASGHGLRWALIQNWLSHGLSGTETRNMRSYSCKMLPLV